MYLSVSPVSANISFYSSSQSQNNCNDCMKVWLGAENPAGTVYITLTVFVLLPPPPHLTTDMKGELKTESR
jgi:hypothetical protein